MPDQLGWYPDPANRHEVRFFDGVHWTEHVADAGTRSADPLGTSAAPASAVAPGTAASRSEPSRRRSRDERRTNEQPTAPNGPGWYPDPGQRHHLRFYDGSTWSRYVADGDGYRVDAL